MNEQNASQLDEKFYLFLIHSANPQSRPIGIIVFAHVVRLYIRPYVPTFQNQAKQNDVKTMFATGATVGLAEWIIDDKFYLFSFSIFFFPLFVTLCNLGSFFERFFCLLCVLQFSGEARTVTKKKPTALYLY